MSFMSFNFVGAELRQKYFLMLVLFLFFGLARQSFAKQNLGG